MGLQKLKSVTLLFGKLSSSLRKDISEEELSNDIKRVRDHER